LVRNWSGFWHKSGFFGKVTREKPACSIIATTAVAETRHGPSREGDFALAMI
jgi:hypothetical protein